MKLSWYKKLFFILVVYPLVSWADTREKEICIFQNEKGKIAQVNSLQEIPENSRKSVKCFSPKQSMAKPEDMVLHGTVRLEKIVSTVGSIEIRWPRKIEGLFGKTPVRAMTDAANTLGRALKNPAFPSHVQNLNMDWKIVFLDENLPENQIPSYLVSNCHPGWMTPPGNIYIVGQRVASGCGGQKSPIGVADSYLAEILLHEMGHSVEFKLLQNYSSPDRKRAEGFASWFSNYASEYSSIINAKDVKKRYFDYGKMAIQKSPEVFSFNGSFEDYSRASLIFSAIVAARGLRDLLEIYEYMNKNKVEFDQAIMPILHWDTKRLNKEVLTFIDKKNK